MLGECVVVKHRHAPGSVLVVDKVDEGIANVAHRPLVDRHVQEVERAAKAEALELADELALRVAVRDVADHHGGLRPLVAALGELLNEVQAPGRPAVREALQAVGLRLVGVRRGVEDIRRQARRVVTSGCAVVFLDDGSAFRASIITVGLVPEFGRRHGVHGAGRPDVLQAGRLAIGHGAYRAVRHDALVARHLRRELALQRPQLVNARSLSGLQGVPSSRAGSLWPPLAILQAYQVVETVK
mmetsp:Transcript_114072/g.158192  ORF Transcript_114072/g.158192 Transcript_114072/m.158192 type:complete len:242 (+) Transcript_114072:419-1144(+)